MSPIRNLFCFGEGPQKRLKPQKGQYSLKKTTSGLTFLWRPLLGLTSLRPIPKSQSASRPHTVSDFPEDHPMVTRDKKTAQGLILPRRLFSRSFIYQKTFPRSSTSRRPPEIHEDRSKVNRSDKTAPRSYNRSVPKSPIFAKTPPGHPFHKDLSRNRQLTNPYKSISSTPKFNFYFGLISSKTKSQYPLLFGLCFYLDLFYVFRLSL